LTIDIQSLYEAISTVYSNRERLTIEFEEIVRNLFAKNKTVVNILPSNTLFKYDRSNKKVALRYNARNYMMKCIPIKSKSSIFNVEAIIDYKRAAFERCYNLKL